MKYAALLRGIMPSNPNMKNEKLKGLFEELGFTNVKTVISSGNVLFESPSKNSKKLETDIEKALPEKLGFNSITIIRSREELEKLVKSNPFKGVKEDKNNYLIVTFFKDRRKELCTVIDMSKGRTPDFMRDIEKQFGKEITTRTWKTVNRIIDKL